ncbi:MAG: two-component regulator propeller domain-containing protein, partial [Bacteroidota bacterium]
DITSYGDTVWVATELEGLWRFDPDGSMRNYTSGSSGLPSYVMTSVCADQDGVLWMGCLSNLASSDGGYGLTRFDGQNWTTYDSTNSDLKLNRIWDISV